MFNILFLDCGLFSLLIDLFRYPPRVRHFPLPHSKRVFLTPDDGLRTFFSWCDYVHSSTIWLFETCLATGLSILSIFFLPVLFGLMCLSMCRRQWGFNVPHMSGRGFSIFIQGKATFVLDMNTTMTIEDVNWMICERLDISFRFLTLSTFSFPLDDHKKTLGDLGIEDGGTIIIDQRKGRGGMRRRGRGRGASSRDVYKKIKQSAQPLKIP